MRVSKADGSQALDLQKDALMKAGVSSHRIYEDLASGRFDDRLGLTSCLKALQPGNTLVVWKLDRLGRNLRHLVSTVDDLKTRNIGFKVLAGQGAEIDTTTSQGKMVFGIFASLAEFERELIIERTKAGLASARARGRLGGRPRKMDVTTLRMAMNAMEDNKSVAMEVARRLGITTTTLYAYINGDGSLKEAGTKLLNQINKNITKLSENSPSKQSDPSSLVP
jgi:DNA invertase Pin-like site-specific DNA recombinase